ncbi:MAG: DUF4330 domain-containing protein [Thermoleophilia bacterium]
MSPFLDDRGRLFGKVSVVDVFVLLLIVALALFAYARFAAPAAVEEPYRLTLYVEKVREATFAQFEVGTSAYDDGGTLLGLLKTSTVTPTPTEVPDWQGRLHDVPSPVFSDVILVIEGTGTVSFSTIRAGSVPLRVGKVLTIQGPGYEVKTLIMGVERLGQ